MKLLRAVMLPLTFGLAILSAQEGPSPLVGKTVLVFNPVPGGVLNLDMSGTAYPMKAAADNWMVYTIPATIQFHIKRFGIRNEYGQGNFWLSRTGMVAAGGADAFDTSDFRGGDSLWIIIDPSGPANAAPYLLTRAPMAINVLNPWEATAPWLVLPGDDRKSMRILSDHCGWFTAFLFKPADMQVRFEEIGGPGLYGMDGAGSRTPFDLAALFAAHPQATTLWLDTERNAWQPAYPGKEGYCRYLMATTVRDFKGSHPDFDFGNIPGELPAPGRIEPTLGATRKPVRSSAPDTVGSRKIFHAFDSWWRTDTGHADTSLRSYETCADLPMSKTADGSWEYESYLDPLRGYWPIEDFANPNNAKSTPSCYNKPDYPSQWTTGGPATNMNFCMETHAAFTYRKGQKFVFRADDDLWVFIDNRLVVDQGGIRIPKEDTVDLDSLGLIEGSRYNWDLFHCERQPCVSSLRIKTSIFFRQQHALDTLRQAGSGSVSSWNIIRRLGGSGSCAAPDILQETPATRLTWLLANARGETVDTLEEGSHHGGGIVIATPKVSVDIAKLSGSGLPRGAYSLQAFEPANPRIRIRIPVDNAQVGTQRRSASRSRSRAVEPPLHDALGRKRDSRKAPALFIRERERK